MKYCKYCGKQIGEDAEICPFCNGIVSAKNKTAAKSSKNGKKASKKASTGLLIVSALVPIVGLVVGFKKMWEGDKTASKYLIVSIVSYSVGYLISFF